MLYFNNLYNYTVIFFSPRLQNYNLTKVTVKDPVSLGPCENTSLVWLTGPWKPALEKRWVRTNYNISDRLFNFKHLDVFYYAPGWVSLWEKRMVRRNRLFENGKEQ